MTSLLTMQAFSIDDARMMRFPDINGNLITFVYAGDIWTVDATGGNAPQSESACTSRSVRMDRSGN